MTNAQVALEAASRIHQKVAAGSGAGAAGSGYSTAKGDIKIDTTQDHRVLATADAFLTWLKRNGG